MKKRIKIIITSILILFLIVILVFTQNSNSLTSYSIDNEDKIAVYIYDIGQGEYVKNNYVPKGFHYSLNTTLSNCLGDGYAFDYDNLTGRVKFSLLGYDKCSLYFDSEQFLLNNEIKSHVGYSSQDSNGNDWFIKEPEIFKSSGFTSSTDISSSTFVDSTAGSETTNFTCSGTTCTSNNAGLHNTTSEITFKVPNEGNYQVCYTISSESGWDKGNFYVDSTKKVNNVSGSSTACTYLGYLTTSNILKGTYSKDSSSNSGSDTFSFNIQSVSGYYEEKQKTGIRYTGKNPDNYVWFNNEYWRIIGVFDELYDTNNDTIPDTTKSLVKIIRQDSIGTYYYDYKASGIGSSGNSSGSNDWSDSELMMFLNPPEFINHGYTDQAGTNQISNTKICTDDSSYICDNNNVKFFKNMGSYYDATKQAYKPLQVYKNYGYGYNSSGSALSESNMAPASNFVPLTQDQDKIATVKWYLGASLAGNLYSLYSNERGTGRYNSNKPLIWYGKIGLMYPSDYGLSTEGVSPSSSDKNAYECSKIAMGSWSSGSNSCHNMNWMYNSSSNQTITPISDRTYASLYYSGYSLYINYSSAYNIRPVLYLKPNVWAYGSGTKDDPYKLNLGQVSTIEVTHAGSTNVQAGNENWAITTNVYICNAASENCSASSANMPTSGYKINRTKSSCTGDGSVGTFNTSTGKLSLVVSSNDTCNIYFDRETLSDYINTNNPAGYRGTNHNNAATQDLYRYVGQYQSSNGAYAGNVDNYICLGSTASTCPDDNMYRIIGVVAADNNNLDLQQGMIKVLKMNKYGSYYMYGGGSDYNDSSGAVYQGNYRSRWTCTASDLNYNSSCFPDWTQSTLNTNILNNTYLNSLSYRDKIANVKWLCYDGTAYATFLNPPVCAGSNKISLLYMMDYYYGYNNVASYDNRETYTPWIWNSSLDWGEWSMDNFGFEYTNGSNMTWSAWAIGNDRKVYANWYFQYENGTFTAWRKYIRPVFYLNSNVEYSSGTGTYANPFRIA